MKHWSKFLEEDPKKQQAAAYEMESSKEMQPPDFNVTSQHSGSSKPIQGMFASMSKMGSLASSAIDVARTPSAPAPVPIPYPVISAPSTANKNTKPSGIFNKLTSGVENLSQGNLGVMGPIGSSFQPEFNGNAQDYIQAVMFGKSMFKFQAKFRDIKIFGPSAIGTPGCLDGPNMENLINMGPTVAGMTGTSKTMRKAVAKGVGDNFDKWRKKVTIPGLPWYPAFAAWPGPMAPPMPNVPMPLISCVSSKLSKITIASQLKSSIYGNLPSNMKNSRNEAFVQAIADFLAMHFFIWVSSQMVTNVLGKGPVPSFAPPLVPVGPVIMGDNIAAPGHLMS